LRSVVIVWITKGNTALIKSHVFAKLNIKLTTTFFCKVKPDKIGPNKNMAAGMFFGGMHWLWIQYMALLWDIVLGCGAVLGLQLR